MRHLANAHLFTEAPDVCAGTEIAPLELAIEHGAARHDDGRYVTTGCAHDERRRGLITAAHQDDAVDRVAADGFFDIHADQVAEEHGRWTQQRFAGGHDRKLKREATRLPHAALHTLSQGAQMSVTGCQL